MSPSFNPWCNQCSNGQQRTQMMVPAPILPSTHFLSYGQSEGMLHWLGKALKQWDEKPRFPHTFVNGPHP